MDSEIEKLKDILGSTVYGSGDDTLQSILPRLLKCPPEAAYQETLSVAESCTGGHLSELITSIPGCSRYYNGSVTSYSNEVKINVLGVDPEIIAKFGAVSQECAEAMAKGVAKLMDTDYSIATTGIAGPDGGSAEKPVGTCWIAAVHRSRTTGEVEVVSKKVLSMSASRDVNIKRFASNALDLLRHLAGQQLF
jgi:nicotinamide-nucleotide amidase